jgi:XTP/dITP diphosphohydrolase
MMPEILVVGTRNRKKLQEIQEILDDPPLRLVDLSEFPNAPAIVEDGGTFEANARKKATGLAVALKQWVLSDDSGLVVPALGGEPGVDSALYAGKHGDDEANNDKLLAKLKVVPEEQRTAYYVCVIAVANPQGEILAESEGRCHGRIVSDRRGAGGFGYDPLFLIQEYHRTFGELSPRVKHALSHRAKALEKLRPTLRHLWSVPEA